jgi:hypothetical protein
MWSKAMDWNGVERRTGIERRCSERRSSVNFSIAKILNGSASQRGGSDRRTYLRRQADRTKSRLVPEQTAEPLTKQVGTV